MAKKFGFFDDIGDQLFELGKSTTKQTFKAVQQIVDPMKMAESVMGKSGDDHGMEQLEKGKGGKQNYSKLDFAKLQKNYQDQDKMKTDMVRQRLFQIVKNQEEKSVMGMRQEDMEKKKQAAYEEQEKRRQEALKKQQESQSTSPQGKIRKSIFSAKKMAKREQAETKPSAGKQ